MAKHILTGISLSSPVHVENYGANGCEKYAIFVVVRIAVIPSLFLSKTAGFQPQQ
jgi:hypothetical protein